MNISEPGEVLTRIDADIDAAVRRAEAAQAFRRSLDTLQGHGEVNGVAVVVEASGMLVDLKLPQLLSRRNSEDLAADVLAAVKLAQATVAQQVQARADEAYGVGSPAATRMRSELTLRFGIEPAST